MLTVNGKVIKYVGDRFHFLNEMFYNSKIYSNKNHFELIFA